MGALPIPSWAVLTAKLSTVLLGEAGIALLVGAPLLVRYGIEMGMPAGFYARALCGLLFLPMAPVAVAALLACLLIRVSALWKRREGVTTVMTFVLLGLIIAAEMSLSMNMDEEELGALVVSMMLGQGGLTETLVSAYPPLRWLTQAITGSGLAAWGNALLFMAFSAGSIALIVALFGRGYMRLALRQEETLSRVNNGARRAGRGPADAQPLLGAVPPGDARGYYRAYLCDQLPDRRGCVSGDDCHYGPWPPKQWRRRPLDADAASVFAAYALSGCCRGSSEPDGCYGHGGFHSRFARGAQA